ncbi:MAG: potassium/proton antiporter [Campylobacter sp.]|nr:potassium/proton antiporter [Campylobacter sp.]
MEITLIVLGLLMIISVFFSKISDRYGFPALLIFLGVGLLAGSDGILKIEFNNAKLAGDIGTIALIYILFSGGLDTDLKAIKPIYKDGLILATFGVIITALILSCFIFLFLDFTFLQSLLLASIISSTDAAAVFAILRSKNIKLKNNIGELLEFESGSNDPMAIFLTVTLIGLISAPTTPHIDEWIVSLLLEFILGGAFGYAGGRIIAYAINKMKLSVWGLYPVFMFAFVLFLFGLSSQVGGNGYIAVYVAGIIANSKEFVHKKNLVGFFDGIAWFMQVVVFLTLGLLAFPKSLPEVFLISVILSLVLMFVARPVSVFLGLIFSKFNLKEKLFISWVGFRGVVPITLATYPLAAGIENAEMMFNIVFSMVIISVFIQGMTLSKLAKFFDVMFPPDEIIQPQNRPIFYSGIRQFTLPKNSRYVGLNLAEAALPDEFLLLLVKRDNENIKPSGSYTFMDGDLFLVYCQDEELYENTIKSMKEQNE